MNAKKKTTSRKESQREKMKKNLYHMVHSKAAAPIGHQCAIDTHLSEAEISTGVRQIDSLQ